MHLNNVDKIVDAMRFCIELSQGYPIHYCLVEDGIQFNKGDRVIGSVEELAAFRAEVELAFGVEGDEGEPEGL